MAQRSALDDPVEWVNDPKAGDELRRIDEETLSPNGRPIRRSYWGGWDPPPQEEVAPDPSQA